MANNEKKVLKSVTTEFFKTSLNVLRSRRLNYEANRSFQDKLRLPPELINPSMLLALNEKYQNDLSLLTSMNNALNNIINDVKMNYTPQRNDANYCLKIMELISNISLIAHYILKAHSDEFSLFDLKLKFIKVLQSFRDHVKMNKLQIVEAKKRAPTIKISKLEGLVNKINLTRVLTRVFIGAFCSDHEKYPHIQSFRTGHRGDLSIHHFKHTWDLFCDE